MSSIYPRLTHKVYRAGGICVAGPAAHTLRADEAGGSGMAEGTKIGDTTWLKVLAIVIAVGATAVAATTGDSWAVRSILVLVAGDVAVRLWRR